MDLLKILLAILFLAFPIAELGKVQIGPVSFTVNDILIFTVLTWWVIYRRKLTTNKEIVLKKPILIFSIVAFISLLLNSFWLSQYEFLTSGLYLIRWIAYASIYFVLASVDKAYINKLKLLIVFPISIFIFLGYVQFIFYQSLRNLYYLGWDEHLYRLFSTFLDPNYAGTFFVLTFIYLLHLAIQNIKNKKLLTLLTTISAFNLFAVYLTFSRSALIMLLTSLIIFLILINKKRLLLIFITTFLVLIFISPKAFQTEGTNIFRINSSEARLDSAKVAVDIIVKNPIIGVGFNSYRFAQHKYGYLKDNIWTTTHSGAGTDNSFLFIMATTGFLGLVSYLYLLYRVLYISKHKDSLISKVLIASLSGVLINSLFINSLFYVYIMEWIWIMTAFTENS